MSLSAFTQSSCSPSNTVLLSDVAAGDVVLASDFTDLRDAINCGRTLNGLSAASWSESITANETAVKAAHITEMRDALAGVFTARGVTQPTYTDSSLTAGDPIKAVHVQELRVALRQFLVAAPTISVAAGTYSTVQSVTLSISTSGAVVRYTLDGSVPTESSPQATSPVAIDVSETLSARAFKSGLFGSIASTATYELQAVSPTISVAAGTYSTVQSVTLSSSTSGAVVRYTLDGSTPTASSTQATSSVSVDTPETLTAGAFKTGWTPSATAAATYAFTAAAPTFSVSAGTYTATQSVTLSSVSGGTIRYTLDGSTPSESSSAYSSSLTVDLSETVTARTFRSSWTPSSATSAAYTITVPTPTGSPTTSTTYDVGQTITLSDSDGSATLRYTTDGSTPSTSSSAYSGAITLNEPTIFKARAFRGAADPSGVLTLSYALRVPAPTMSPDEGYFDSMPSVALSTTLSGATIRYTTDTTEPTETSTAYTSSIQAGQYTSIKAQASKTGWVASDVTTKSYFSNDLVSLPVESAGSVSRSGGSVTTSNALGGTVTLSLSGATIASSDTVAVLRNGVRLTSGLTVNASSVAISSALVEGRNELSLEAVDSYGSIINYDTTMWAGSRSVSVTVYDDWGNPLQGATVSAALKANADIVTSGTTNSNGTVTLSNLPTGENVMLSASADTFRPWTFEFDSSYSTANFTLNSDNNDLSQGIVQGVIPGWYLPYSYSYALVVTHSESSQALVPCNDCNVRFEAIGGPSVISDQKSGATSPYTGSGDADLYIESKNLSPSQPQTATRVFYTKPGTTSVTVRYRFQSDEIYTALPQNSAYQSDTFAVSLSAQTSNQQASDNKTVSALYNASLFDSNAATAWRTLTVPTAQDGDVVTMTATVANVGDSAYLSMIYVDSITETNARIQKAQLFDLINSNDTHASVRPDKGLAYLSATSMPGSPINLVSYEGYVRIHGAISIQGPSSESLSEVWVEVWDHGTKIATGQLARAAVSSVRSQLLGVTFGSTGKISVGYDSNGDPLSITPLLFEIPSTEFAGYSQTANNPDVLLQIHARRTSNSVQLPVLNASPTVTKLVLYTGTARMSGTSRDLGDCVGLKDSFANERNRPAFPCGGDSWGLPSTVSWANGVTTVTGTRNGKSETSTVTWNDFSNMNGGFFPVHVEHRNGRVIDGIFAGYLAKDATTAQKILNLLNTYGSQVDHILVGYSTTSDCSDTSAPSNSNPFWNVIKEATLADGRAAKAVIWNAAEHCDHFHVVIKAPQ